MDLVAAAWPNPVCATMVATCDRHILALVSCGKLAADRTLTAGQQIAYLQRLADHFRAVCPTTTHTFEWLFKQLRSDQRLSLRF